MKTKRILQVFLLFAMLLAGFPEKVEARDVLPAPPPGDMFQLPWEQGLAWVAYSGFDNGSRRPRTSPHNYLMGGAIDFAPHANMVVGEDTSNFWVTAAANGTVTTVSSCHIVIDHGNGWMTEYWHLANIQVRKFDVVTRNQRLAVIADNVRTRVCTGNLHPGPHLHFVMRPKAAETKYAGWAINFNSTTNTTTFTKNGTTLGLFQPLLNSFDGVPTSTPTRTPTATNTATATNPPTNTPTATNIPASATPTSTGAPTATNTPVVTNTFTPTNTPPAATATDTPAVSNTPTFTATSAVSTETFTPTATIPVSTATFTPTATIPVGTATFTPTATSVIGTATFTPTATIPVGTATFTPTATSAVGTATFTPTATLTGSTATFTPTVPVLPTGPYVRTSASPQSLLLGQNALVTVSLNNVPAGGYVSGEFTCTYDQNLISVSNITMAGLFGPSPVVAINGPQNGSFILAIVGIGGNKATTDGAVFTFQATGLQTGQTPVVCTARVSQGLSVYENIAFVGDTITVNAAVTATAPPTATNVSLPPPIVNGQVLASKPVTIRLYNPDSTLAATIPANPDGTFNFNAAAGSYTIVASAEGFLNAQGSVTLTDGSTTSMPVISLIPGDVDGNSVINQLDALTIGMNYNNTAPTAADLNNDGIINVLDLQILALHYGQSGALAW
ncbi:MAG: peptidoglycan DD-metalloendopeptidase family protein [Anaerolineales bacterium]|nr:peptidoglycan DD-metalloendopeptidase family protein [Anaerolineales bacterium]